MPEYDLRTLAPIWEGIVKEYEQLTNHYEYTQQLRKINYDAEKVNRLTAMIACFYLIKYGGEIDKYTDYWKIPQDLAKLKLLILQEKTRLNIDAIKKHKETPKLDFDFDKIVVQVENSLERNIDIDMVSVKKWVYLCKSIEEKSKAIDKLRHGRARQNISE